MERKWESLEKLIESWENIVYDEGLDIFIFSSLGDNMQMEMEVVTASRLNNRFKKGMN